ncbi:MAG: cation:proton antiporter domain-containing protein [Paracoccaceae bacterium]
MQDMLTSILLYLGAALVAVPIAARAGLGSVLGYLIAGIAIGLIPGIGAETQELQRFAEFGVVVMLFIVGLELEPRALWAMRSTLIGMGGAQVVGTVLVLAGGAWAMGAPWPVAVALGMALTLSSTAIVLQSLSERSLMQSPGGRASFAVLLAQDIAVIAMFAIVPLLAVGATGGGDALGAAEGMSLIAGLPPWGAALVTLAAVASVIGAGTYATRPVFRWIHQARMREMYTALSLLIVVGVAVLMELVGLSPALGAFLAGVVLAGTEFKHELEADLEPFKGLLLGLFFITVGAGIDFGLLAAEALQVIALVVGTILGKVAVLWAVATAFGLRGRDRILFSLGLAQAGEFGFVLVSVAVTQGVLSGEEAATALLVIALTMMATPVLFVLHDRLARRGGGAQARPPHDTIDRTGTVIVAGIGRFGQVVNRLVQSSGYSTVVLDTNLETVQLMRRFGFRGFFGDPTRPDTLHAAGLADARVLVAALDDKAENLRLVSYARSMRPDLRIVARARDRVHVYELRRAGADDVVRELFDSSLRAGRYALEALGMSDWEAHAAETAFYDMDRSLLRELADLWRPGVPIEKNEPYVARAREASRELEVSLAAALDEPERRKTDDG